MKTILITGCGRRLGFGLVQNYLSKGDTVFAVTRTINDGLAQLRQQYPDKLKVIECGEYNAAGGMKTIESIADADIDIVINNASLYEDDERQLGAIADKFQRFFEVHMLFPTVINEWFGQKYALSSEVGAKNVINITDIFADNPSQASSHYCSTKAGLESLTKSLAKKYAPQLRVNSVQPGPVKFLPSHSEASIKKVLSETLLASEGGFECLIDTIEFIVNNHYLTGVSIKVDGGRSINRG
ncbi:SDR family NAD(P)-dependent oxidoreductase [Aliiglaciecola litoralis]|uniref:Dihydromonapterin reductase n=1 Tax=Aliiglaciecola litoralis TaxID=582857 RepID=A0ABP3X3W9_9ALTE